MPVRMVSLNLTGYACFDEADAVADLGGVRLVQQMLHRGAHKIRGAKIVVATTRLLSVVHPLHFARPAQLTSSH